jgi:hypothetical protein
MVKKNLSYNWRFYIHSWSCAEVLPPAVILLSLFYLSVPGKSISWEHKMANQLILAYRHFLTGGKCGRDPTFKK